MPERKREIDEHMQEAIDKFDADCKLTDKEWSDLDADVQDDLALLAEIGEAVCRVSSPSEADDADTDLAWERMKARMTNDHQQEDQAKEGETKEEEVKETEVTPVYTKEEKTKETQPDKKKKKNTKTRKLRIVYYSVAAVAAALLLLFLVSKPKEGGQGFRSVATLTQKTSPTASKEDKTRYSRSCFQACHKGQHHCDRHLHSYRTTQLRQCFPADHGIAKPRLCCRRTGAALFTARAARKVG